MVTSEMVNDHRGVSESALETDGQRWMVQLSRRSGARLHHSLAVPNSRSVSLQGACERSKWMVDALHEQPQPSDERQN
jgi:hypothetical protein